MIDNDLGFALAVIGTPVITLVASVFVWRGFRTMWTGRRRRGWLALIPTALLAPVIGLGVYLVVGALWVWHPTLDFDRERWFAKPERRHWMTERIIESGMLVGKTQGEAEELLSYDYFITDVYGNPPEYKNFKDNPSYMVWYTGYHRTALGLLAKIPDNSLMARLENGVIVEVSENHHAIPDGPIVRTSGFAVDPSLDSLTFSARDSVKQWRGTSGGLARVERHYVEEGVSTYLAWPPQRPRGVGRREWAGRLAAMRDTLQWMNHVSEHYPGLRLLYEVGDVFYPYRNYYEKVYFGYYNDGGFEVRLIIDEYPPLPPLGATTVVEAEVWFRAYTDYGPNEFVLDSVSLAFSRVPVGTGRLVGRVYASRKFPSATHPEDGIYHEGVFEITLPELTEDNYDSE
jgi:hypothetical protein